MSIYMGIVVLFTTEGHLALLYWKGDSAKLA